MSWLRRAGLAKAGRRTNIALLWLVIAAFVSGWVAFAFATPAPAWIAATVHGLLGLAVVALAPWKTMIIRRSTMRSTIRWASLALLSIMVAGLIGGFAQFFVGWHPVLGISPIQLHVGAAVVLIPLLAWHVLRHRPQRLRRSDLSRRMLLRGVALAGAVGAGYVVLDVASRWTGGRGRTATSTGSRRVGADAIPATIWLLDRVPEPVADYPVEVAGRTFTAGDVAKGAGTVTARLDCTSGWYADATWTGQRLADLISSDALAAATSLVVTSTTGYTRTFPASDARALWLVTACQGRPLTAATGAPVRLSPLGDAGSGGSSGWPGWSSATCPPGDSSRSPHSDPPRPHERMVSCSRFGSPRSGVVLVRVAALYRTSAPSVIRRSRSPGNQISEFGST